MPTSRVLSNPIQQLKSLVTPKLKTDKLYTNRVIFKKFHNLHSILPIKISPKPSSVGAKITFINNIITITIPFDSINDFFLDNNELKSKERLKELAGKDVFMILKFNDEKGETQEINGNGSMAADYGNIIVKVNNGSAPVGISMAGSTYTQGGEEKVYTNWYFTATPTSGPLDLVGVEERDFSGLYETSYHLTPPLDNFGGLLPNSGSSSVYREQNYDASFLAVNSLKSDEIITGSLNNRDVYGIVLSGKFENTSLDGGEDYYFNGELVVKDDYIVGAGVSEWRWGKVEIKWISYSQMELGVDYQSDPWRYFERVGSHGGVLFYGNVHYTSASGETMERYVEISNASSDSTRQKLIMYVYAQPPDVSGYVFIELNPRDPQLK